MAWPCVAFQDSVKPTEESADKTGESEDLMNPESMPSLSTTPSQFGDDAAASSSERATSTTHSARHRYAPPSRLAQRLSAPWMQLADGAAMLTALSWTLMNAPLREGQTLTSYLELRISVRNLLIEAVLLGLWRLTFWLTGMYQPKLTRRAAAFLWKLPATTLLCTIPVLPVLRSKQLLGQMPHSEMFFFVASSVLLLTIRGVLVGFEQWVRPALRPRRTAVVCGTGPLARAQVLRLQSHPNFRYELLGFVDDDPRSGIEAVGPVLCNFAELDRWLMHHAVDEVVVGLPLKSRFGDVQQIVSVCGKAGIPMQYSTELFDSAVAKNQRTISDGGHRMLVEMVHGDHRVLLKNVLDRVLAAVALLALLPVLAVIAVAVRLSSPGPVLFVQQRYGLNKRRFGMIKFRSMVIDAEARQAALEHLNESGGPTFKIKGDPRITPVGAFLRRTSLDELPQLLNVLRGEMSIVGPRPLPIRDVERFAEPWLMRRFSVKPGITGLWQVSGRSNMEFDHAIQLDLRYIDQWSLLADLGILLRTVVAVFRARGAY